MRVKKVKYGDFQRAPLTFTDDEDEDEEDE